MQSQFHIYFEVIKVQFKLLTDDRLAICMTYYYLLSLMSRDSLQI